MLTCRAPSAPTPLRTPPPRVRRVGGCMLRVVSAVLLLLMTWLVAVGGQ